MNDEELTLSASIQHYIKKGLLDNSLDDLYEAISARRKRIARDLFHDLRVGDTVQINEHIKPKYMVGQTGTVVDKRQSKVEVEFDRPMGRFGQRVICPVTSLKKLTR
jgi:ribosomal protein L21E